MILKNLRRREFIQYAALAVSGASAVSASSRATAGDNHQHTQQKPAEDFLHQHPASLFSESQSQIVAAIARLIIPTTDTPGADEANTALFIELMVQHWFTDTERDLFMQGLGQLERMPDSGFHTLNPDLQLAALEQLEAKAKDASWFELGNVARTWDSNAPFICQIKELTVLGFMLSEVGSSQFLDPNPMGEFNGELSIKKDTSSYAVDMPIRVFSKSL